MAANSGGSAKTRGSLEEPSENKVKGELSHRTVNNRTMHYGVAYVLGLTK